MSNCQFVTALFIIGLITLAFSFTHSYKDIFYKDTTYPDEYYWNETRNCLPLLPIPIVNSFGNQVNIYVIQN